MEKEKKRRVCFGDVEEMSAEEREAYESLCAEAMGAVREMAIPSDAVVDGVAPWDRCVGQSRGDVWWLGWE